MQAQAFADLQVDRHVGRRAAGEEGGQAALAQAQQDQRIGVAAQFPPDDGGVDHQGHDQHGADQHQQQSRIAEQGLQAGIHQGGGHQAEHAERGEMDDHLDDQRDAAGQVAEGRPGGFAALADRQAEADGPGENADVVGFQQGLDRVAGDVEQQGLEHLADATGRVGAGGGLGQRQRGGPQTAGEHRDDGGAQSAQQVEHQHRTDVGRLTLRVAGDGGGDQQEHQHRGHSLQRGDEQLTEQARLWRGLGQEQGQQDTGDQADENLRDQAGTGEQLQEGTLDHVYITGTRIEQAGGGARGGAILRGMAAKVRALSMPSVLCRIKKRRAMGARRSSGAGVSGGRW